MTKFKFNYLHNTLSIHQEGDIWHQIPEEKQFTTEYGNLGFKLSPSWITFTLYENKIRVFYKQVEAPAWFTYYRKDLPKECPVIFEFNEADEVEKTTVSEPRKEVIMLSVTCQNSLFKSRVMRDLTSNIWKVSVNRSLPSSLSNPLPKGGRR